MRYLVKRVMRRSRLFRRRTQGMAAVEFAMLGTALIFIFAGIFDFGHAWYLQQLVTSASREGARYGVAYQVDSTATRIAPNALSPSIQSHVTSLAYLSGLSITVPTPTGTGYSGTYAGVKSYPVNVTVQATKTWFMLGAFLPASALPATMQATTTMSCE